ncbi:CAAX prenyl protease 1, putative [Trypanosoma equiperdum]|uniref:CAAX prenyl protease n=3 Tax=Trypanozoon TaxID=39700 RepID=C9ZYC0_TRYB9|nr:CAAX prenyl protease 1, putative [Trypanosoma brucei gambiense DAL972]RHW70529.1 CAAX prenyl protease 1 [Trypanosoma brucei equiperdum]CBH14419.1 CAAX prenyl protease 1, putative [Trypanosoma brucei gambiense DAL972]SCU64398.1 CAAX prenyl protease 1, putative [Trypanosoma equiperdum]|eukprot:XP_011776685.1 CAAX prenyl protease 1, putative [Trypanosoma brucei gambiense DAL972]
MVAWGGMTFYGTALIGLNALALWDLYLQRRQRKAYANAKMPEHLVGVVEEKEFRTTQEYEREKLSFSILLHVKDIVISNVSLLAKLPAKLYGSLGQLLPGATGSFSHCYVYAVATDVLTTLISLPFEYYSTFVIEEKHGFNKMTRKEFFLDVAKYFLLRLTLLHVLTSGLILKVVELFGEDFPFYFFLGATGLITIFTFVYPTFIQPLFNTYTPIPKDGELGKKIYALAEKHKFPLKKLYEVDGSRRSGHSNAYFYGFWSKHIVLYDTIVEQTKGDHDALLAVLCHELGHWKNSHDKFLFGFMVAQTWCISYGAKAVIFNTDLYKQFGFSDANPLIGFELFSQVFLEPINTLLGYLVSLVTRQFEFQADRYAVSSGYGEPLIRGLMVIHKENKNLLTPDPLFAALHYSHPPLAQRLDAIKEENKKRK